MRPGLTSLLAGVLVWSSVALGATPFASVASLDSAAHARLDAGIAKARRDSPAAFGDVAAIVARADALDHAKRGRFYPMTPLLRDATRGRPGASLALLEPLLFPERFTMPASESARIALRAGLIEASGDLRDPAAAPVYRSIVATGTEFFEVRAAVEALGKLGTDSDAALISNLALTPGPKQDAAIAGLGGCRRLAAASALARLGAQKPEGARARALLWSLATMASAWALATPNAAPAAESAALRDAAARGALAVFVGAEDPSVRLEASNALMTIDAPDTPSWIAAAKRDAAPALAAELDALAIRFAHNPTRRTR